MAVTFALTLIAWVFFRAESVGQAIQYLGGIFNKTLFMYPALGADSPWLLIAFFLTVEWLQREKQHALQLDGIRMPKIIRWAFYLGIILLMIKFGTRQQEFIYFQF